MPDDGSGKLWPYYPTIVPQPGAAHPVKQRSSFAVELTNVKTWCSVCGALLDDEPDPGCENCRLMVKLKEGS